MKKINLALLLIAILSFHSCEVQYTGKEKTVIITEMEKDNGAIEIEVKKNPRTKGDGFEPQSCRDFYNNNMTGDTVKIYEVSSMFGKHWRTCGPKK